MSASGRSDIHSSAASATSARIGPYLPLIVVLVAAAWLTPQWLNPVFINADVSWLLHLGQATFGGARPYVDFTETNPPASILIYMPALLLGHWLALPPEYVLLALIWLGAIGSVALAGSILLRSSLVAPRELPLFAALAFALLFILPAYSFSQRGHIALIAVLPMLAVYAARANGRDVAPAVAFLCGLGGGITVSIKPYFVLALLFPFLFVLWRVHRDRRGSVRIIFSPENVALVLTGALYLGAVFVWFSGFIRYIVPADVALYFPIRLTLAQLLELPMSGLLLATAAMACALGDKGRALKQPLIVVSGLSAAGFAVAYFVQGKGYTYQAYPAIALLMLLAGILVVRRVAGLLSLPSGSGRELRWAALVIVACLFPALFLGEWVLFNAHDDLSRVVRAVESLSIRHPRILALSADVTVGEAAARQLHGRSVARSCCYWPALVPWMMEHRKVEPGSQTRILGYGRRDAALIVEDIGAGTPDILLVDPSLLRLSASSYPEIGAALGRYRKIDEELYYMPAGFKGGIRSRLVEIWVRRDRPLPPGRKTGTR